MIWVLEPTVVLWLVEHPKSIQKHVLFMARCWVSNDQDGLAPVYPADWVKNGWFKWWIGSLSPCMTWKTIAIYSLLGCPSCFACLLRAGFVSWRNFPQLSCKDWPQLFHAVRIGKDGTSIWDSCGSTHIYRIHVLFKKILVTGAWHGNVWRPANNPTLMSSINLIGKGSYLGFVLFWSFFSWKTLSFKEAWHGLTQPLWTPPAARSIHPGQFWAARIWLKPQMRWRVAKFDAQKCSRGMLGFRYYWDVLLILLKQQNCRGLMNQRQYAAMTFRSKWVTSKS